MFLLTKNTVHTINKILVGSFFNWVIGYENAKIVLLGFWTIHGVFKYVLY